MNKLIFTVLFFGATGCSTLRGSLAVGVGTGAAIGAASTLMMAHPNKGQSVFQGALIGGLIGGVGSYFLHNILEQRDDRTRRDTLFNLEKFNVSVPPKYQTAPTTINGPGLTVPRVDAQWVETQVQGKKLIEGHRVWVITEDAQWMPNSTRSK